MNFPRYWTEGAEWQGKAKVGDYIGFDGHIYVLIHEPSVIKLVAMDTPRVKPHAMVMTEGDARF